MERLFLPAEFGSFAGDHRFFEESCHVCKNIRGVTLVCLVQLQGNNPYLHLRELLAAIIINCVIKGL